jgi:hypothetical protein
VRPHGCSVTVADGPTEVFTVRNSVFTDGCIGYKMQNIIIAVTTSDIHRQDDANTSKSTLFSKFITNITNYNVIYNIST